ncbi:fimbrial biogenesis outer membrane usher protein [Salmonella enterica subsp. enterica serovar Infantis]|nr:fimbrial biogenesis outer membrane usher protein [Salmonella enterica subsp. enterica serovar Mbandaka]OVG38892.1 usher protein [Klebsiella pneumoniae]
MHPVRLLRSPVSSLLSALLLCHPAAAAEADKLLYLSVSINGSPVQGLTRVNQQGDSLSILAQDASRLNIRTDDLPAADGYIQLAPRDGLKYEYDALSQTLKITADRSRLGGGQRLQVEHGGAYLHENQLSPPVTGVALNYSLFASHDSDNQYLTGYTEARTFGIGPGTLSSSFNTRMTEHHTTSDDTGTRRLMTWWNWENVDKMLSLTAGDSYTATQSWTSSVRFGGISLSHSYSMQPSVNTSAQDILTDTVTMPSTVDLYIQGVKSASRQVTPGQFTLNTSPILTGTGSAQVVITDINGQQRVVNLALYGSNQLLSAGLTDWTVNAGWVRKNYTYKSFSYDPSFVTVGDIRHGVSKRLTLESHTEQGGNLNNLGAGMNYLLSPALGILHSDLSWGCYRNDAGMQWGTGWQWNNRSVNVSLSHIQRNSAFRDISSIADNSLATREDSSFVGWSVPVIGTLGVSWIDRRYPDEETRYAGLSWSRTFGRHLIMSASYTQTLDASRDKTLYVNINVPLFSSRDNLSLQHNHDTNGNSEQVSLSHSLESNTPGWGWNASARNGSSNDSHLTVQRRNTWSDMELGMNRYSSQKEYYASMSGAVGLFMGNVYATRELGDAFVLVDTEGVPDVPVLLEHRKVGKTDSNGRLFLNDLLPYQENHINIDALHLGADYRAPYTGQDAIPRRNNGAVARFSVYRTRSILLVARLPDGKPVPFSAQVQILDQHDQPPARGTLNTVTGYDGNIYLEDAPANGHARVTWNNGQCTITLPAAQADTASMRRDVICQ